MGVGGWMYYYYYFAATLDDECDGDNNIDGNSY